MRQDLNHPPRRIGDASLLQSLLTETRPVHLTSAPGRTWCGLTTTGRASLYSPSQFSTHPDRCTRCYWLSGLASRNTGDPNP